VERRNAQQVSERRVLEDPFYYLANFRQLVDWIHQRYADLLSAQELQFIAELTQLSRPAQALFVRMVIRSGDVFRAGKLRYDEIGDVQEAVAPLLALGWVERDPSINIDQLFDLLQKSDIALVFSLTGKEKALRKADQLALLRLRLRLPALMAEQSEQSPEQKPDRNVASDATQLSALPSGEDSDAFRQCFSDWHPTSDEPVYRILNQHLCDRLRLMYFGNFHQDWSEFVLSDLGIYRYEQVNFSLASRAFNSRRDVDDTIALQRCRELFFDNAPLGDVLQQLEKCALGSDWLRRRRQKFLFQIGQQLEKVKDWGTAYSVYSSCSYPGARLRTIRVLEKSGCSDTAFALVSAAQQAPESEAERQQLLRIAPRLNRKLGLEKAPLSAALPVQMIALTLPLPAAPFFVEGVVRDHLIEPDAPVHYVENTLINSLFGLLCWDAIFTPLPGAFFHPFHRGPVDLYSLDFRQRRAPEFAACLAALDSGHYRARILDTYAEKSGIQSPFVVWPVLSMSLLELALACIPAQHLKLAFERILQDIRANRNGFPDLIQFWPAQQRYRMIEVKGPGDRLQDNQKRWLDYCAEHQMPVAVCHVEWRRSDEASSDVVGSRLGASEGVGIESGGSGD
jgi:hypothetical protein